MILGFQNNLEVSELLAGFLEYALEDESTHVVMCPFFLDVFTPFQLREVLDKIARILKKKGRLFVSDFQYTTCWSKQLIKLMYVFFGMSTRIAVRQLETLNTLILAKEFETNAHLFRKDGMIFSKSYTKINTD